MMCNLLGTVWLLCCTLSLGVVQAARTMQTRTRPRDSFIQVGLLLKLATWNCGGLSFMQREMCRDLDYDLLALTETHDKGTLQRKEKLHLQRYCTAKRSLLRRCSSSIQPPVEVRAPQWEQQLESRVC